MSRGRPGAVVKRALSFLLFASLASEAGAQQSNHFYGQVIWAPYEDCPVGWLDLDGSLLRIKDNTELFALLGTVYGGDGIETFGLPHAAPKFDHSGALLRPCIANTGTFPPRP